MRIVALLGILASLSSWQAPPAPAYPDFSGWDIVDGGGRTMSYLGRPSLYLERGIALMPGAPFADGVIEFDVAIHGHTGFAGMVFRAESHDDYELIYLRAHRSRQWDALQYTPMFSGQEAWQLYTGAGYNGAAELPLNRWVHVKVVLDGYTAQVFVDDAVKPQMIVTDLKRAWARGRIGLWGRAGAANFSNVRVLPIDRPAPARETRPAEANAITRWSLSQSFVAASVPADHLPAGLTWEPVPAEQSGLVNIASHRRPVDRTAAPPSDDGRDTVFARTVLRTTNAQRVRLSFGYSDDVVVFLDGKAVFAGRAGYLVRDGSYLGTVTFDNDALFLDLDAGRHELVFAVSEAFGGWGLAARLHDASGVTVE